MGRHVTGEVILQKKYPHYPVYATVNSKQFELSEQFEVTEKQRTMYTLDPHFVWP